MYGFSETSRMFPGISDLDLQYLECSGGRGRGQKRKRMPLDDMWKRRSTRVSGRGVFRRLSCMTHFLSKYLPFTQALTLDCGNHWPGGPVNQKIHWPPKKPTGPPQKHVMTQMFSRREFTISRVKLHTFVH